ncbi:hypothetical protein [Clostridium formicaceticum]|uniref:Uncharacterized protein n=1 Tax=Clostridium formicaceticum TaxID=1497 RepID=A0AAC9WGM3_9CLOT|nr:hypothetical protein [Clostridium formicaceticum]ARE88107.1 hypothetical protein CLFO_25080 [Clostridium formicaceticum]
MKGRILCRYFLKFIEALKKMKITEYMKCYIIVKNSDWSILIAAAQAQINYPRK